MLDLLQAGNVKTQMEYKTAPQITYVHTTSVDSPWLEKRLSRAWQPSDLQRTP